MTRQENAISFRIRKKGRCNFSEPAQIPLLAFAKHNQTSKAFKSGDSVCPAEGGIGRGKFPDANRAKPGRMQKVLNTRKNYSKGLGKMASVLAESEPAAFDVQLRKTLRIMTDPIKFPNEKESVK